MWTSPADERWRAVRSVLDGAAANPTNEGGLPKRVPKARLLPGSAAPVEPEDGNQPTRSAAVARERMTTFQQGVRRGRQQRRLPE